MSEGHQRGGGYGKFDFTPAVILRKVRESPKVVSFYLRADGMTKPEPGQFYMVWLPGAEEVPLGASGFYDGVLRISIAKAGPTTSRMHSLKRGEVLFLRGPFGMGFSLRGRSFLLVAGGYGAAPLIYAAERISSSGGSGTYMVGARTARELLFLREARRYGMKVLTATEDGSHGFKGMVADLLPDVLREKKFDMVLTCGPEMMMYEVVRSCLREGIQVEVSLERHMKCGFGICGSCVLDPIGARVCVDGPVFNGALLMATDFGKWKRDECGCRVRA
ncbi:MAG: dihydroorotate dehydrogenase electron transfer subunit [Candidatus Hadarchaeales archaeon]